MSDMFIHWARISSIYVCWLQDRLNNLQRFFLIPLKKTFEQSSLSSRKVSSPCRYATRNELNIPWISPKKQIFESKWRRKCIVSTLLVLRLNRHYTTRERYFNKTLNVDWRQTTRKTVFQGYWSRQETRTDQ